MKYLIPILFLLTSCAKSEHTETVVIQTDSGETVVCKAKSCRKSRFLLKCSDGKIHRCEDED